MHAHSSINCFIQSNAAHACFVLSLFLLLFSVLASFSLSIVRCVPSSKSTSVSTPVHISKLFTLSLIVYSAFLFFAFPFSMSDMSLCLCLFAILVRPCFLGSAASRVVSFAANIKLHFTALYKSNTSQDACYHVYLCSSLF